MTGKESRMYYQRPTMKLKGKRLFKKKEKNYIIFLKVWSRTGEILLRYDVRKTEREFLQLPYKVLTKMLMHFFKIIFT